MAAVKPVKHVTPGKAAVAARTEHAPPRFNPRKFAEAMWRANLDAVELAGIMGCSPDAIGRWMAGIATPRPGYSKGAADIIGVDEDVFYD